MSESDDRKFLAELAAQSREAQQRFMERIAGRMNRPRIQEAPEHPFRGAPDFWRAFEWSEEEKVERFTANFLAVGGHVHRMADLAQARRFIADHAAELHAKRLLRQHDPLLEELELESELPNTTIGVWGTDADADWKACAAEADIGLVAADHAVAYTGSIVVQSSPDKGRSVSLLPTVLIVLIPLERLRTRLGEVMIGFDRMGREALPAGIHFISGPSRSADIENDLTIGVHGPGVVHALLIG